MSIMWDALTMRSSPDSAAKVCGASSYQISGSLFEVKVGKPPVRRSAISSYRSSA